MSNTGDPATVSRLWIEDNVALFVVIVISAVLLIVALITLLVYCCRCRRKTDHWSRQRIDSKSTASHLHVELQHGDNVDADSAVTATIRGPGMIEIHIEKEHDKQQELPMPDYPEYENVQLLLSSQQVPEIVVSADEIHVQEAEFPPLPPLSQDVEVTPEAEMRLHSRPPPELKVEVAMQEGEEDLSPMRLPRTEVVLRTESPSWQIQQQYQQPLRASPPTFRTAPPPAAVAVTVRGSGRVSHEHRHGSSIYQSDDNEITIVDSDFSDYEDTPEDQARRRRKKALAPALQFGVGATAEAAAADFGWETLPNKMVQPDEEPSIFAVGRHGEEYVPAPSPSPVEQQQRRAESLAELDRTLDVFQQQVDDAEAGVEFGGGGGGDGDQVEVKQDFVYEDEIQPLDRSQVPH